ncbi:TPA: hypothetical protein DDZ01_00255 [Candidatus Uhrbacteria bacterium]|nr:MAG: hypothetical protein A2332_03290 [Candidatus Uhrbacteria bacterium RIFOXYB2_FULL_41_18]HBK34421.1 hypothetical protein [Candidatus Uhrbacteria bacterium]HCB55750.1 hypothetical protein [Candidatus Uhrbacteria bacterium]
MQRHEYKSFKKYFCSARKKRKNGITTLWNEYLFKRQTVSDLSESTGLSERTIRRRLREKPISLVPPKPNLSEMCHSVALIMDTTFLK